MEQNRERTGVELPYEQAAMNKEPMPEGLEFPDQIMYQGLRYLYAYYKMGWISLPHCSIEKRYMLEEYRRKEELQYVIRVPEDGNLKGAVPIWEKELLTLSEAAAYFGLGLSKVRSLAEDEECDYILRIGPKSLIKRKRFEEFLDQAYSI